MTETDLQCAYRCAAEVVRRRRLTGEPIPPWLNRYYVQLDTKIRMSARGQQNSLNTDQSDTLSSMEVAQLIGRNDRWVRRHRDELGGIQQGDRWRFPRTAVEHWKETH
ncbi:helix-turn-helix domain-containing protein [Mycobacterium sp. HUMS_1102779]|uniref:helix-turn-helix domain-containing protein n=1 Tax=Mycobacterium sp. HUMS_1102779 TaxID=3383487 RepID=UPI00389A3F5A